MTALDQQALEAARGRDEILSFLAPLSADYPGFEDWYRTRVVPGLLTGTRRILRVERDGRLVGVGIAKNDGIERKICTLRIAPEFVGRGLGPRLMDDMLTWLGADRPLATVSDAKLPAFTKIFDRYGFRLTSSAPGLYLPGRVEHAFNEAEPAKEPDAAELFLPVNGVYFDQIRDGTKLEEFRLATPYWRKRLEGRSYSEIVLTKGYPPANDNSRRLRRAWKGYRQCEITHPHFGPEPVQVFAIDVSESSHWRPLPTPPGEKK